jgi:hypothetical protein
VTTLTILGLLSMAFTAAFTWHAYYGKQEGVGQSRRASIIEAWSNIAFGFTVNFTANLFLLPLVHATFTSWENFMLGWIYTVVSIVRQYTLRRWFNQRIHLFAARAASLGTH